MTETFSASVFELSAIYSQAVLLMAPAILLIDIAKNRRVALYMCSETLIFMTIAYTFRYRAIFTNLLTGELVAEQLHLALLILSSVVVYNIHDTADMPKPTPAPTSESSEDADESEVEEMTAVLGQPKFVEAKDKSSVVFNPRLFGRVLFFSFLPTLYLGDHSLVARGVKAYTGKPNASFWDDMLIQLYFAIAMLEVNALTLLLSRTMTLRRAQIHLAPPSNAELERRGVTLDEWRQRLLVPRTIWGFMWLTQLGGALALPSLIKQAVDGRDKETGDTDDRLVYQVIGCGLQLVILAVFLVFYKLSSRSKGKIQLPEDVEKEEVKAGESA